MKIALCQMNTTVGDIHGNCARILEWSEKAKEQGAKVAIFPELSVTGYPPEDLVFKKDFVRRNLLAVRELSQKISGITVLAGFIGEGSGLFNSAAVLRDGRIDSVYHKMLLPNYSVFDEMRYFQPGSECVVFETGGISFGVTICEDIWHRKGPAQKLASDFGAEVLLNLSASPYYRQKSVERLEVLRARAEETGARIVYVNCVGGQDELVFDGGSMVVGPDGSLVSRAAQFEEELHVCELDRGRITPQSGETEEVYRALVTGTRDYVRKNGFKKVVVGLSGGIDSALTAVIAADALGAGNVVTVTMPSRFTSNETRSDAGKLSGNLGTTCINMPIESALASYQKTFSESAGEDPSGVTFENMQARIRGNFLMALSNQNGWLVLTTGNKSEASTGYCTLYGDMAGGFMVIKDVLKTMVYRLAEYRNSREGRPLIPESIIAREPSAELRPNQKDTDSLPPYGTLDPVLEAYVEHDKGLAEIVGMGYDEKLVKKVISMVDSSEYKRRQAPPGIKITKKSLGKDRRLPITNRFNPAL